MNKATREGVYKKFNGRCAYCGTMLEMRDMQVDHIKSVYNGGKDDIENLNPSCRMCNFYKQSGGVEYLREQLSQIVDRLLERSFIFRLAVAYRLVTINRKPIIFYFEEQK